MKLLLHAGKFMFLHELYTSDSYERVHVVDTEAQNCQKKTKCQKNSKTKNVKIKKSTKSELYVKRHI